MTISPPRVLLAVSLFTISVHAHAAWTNENGGKHYGSPEAACRGRIEPGVSYQFDHVKEVAGRPDLRECYVKAKKGSHVAFWGYASEEPGPPEPQKSNTEKDDTTASADSASAPPGDEEKKCPYVLKKSTKPLGGDPLSDELCKTASGNAPSYRVYPKGKDGKAGSKLVTEIDALQGNTWYECKCGYSSTAEGVAKGQKTAVMSVEAPGGLDQKILTQIGVADACDYEYRLAVANPTVAQFLGEKYPSVTVEVVNFPPCQ